MDHKVKFESFDKLQSKQDAHQLPIVSVFSADGLFTITPETFDTKKRRPPIHNLLRLEGFDMGISQLWPLYSRSSEQHVSELRSGVQEAVLSTRSRSRLQSASVLVIDLVPSPDENDSGVTINSVLPPESMLSQMMVHHFESVGLKWRIENSEHPMSALHKPAEHTYSIQLKLPIPLLDDLLVRTPIHQTFLQVLIRELLLLMSGAIKAGNF